MKISYDQFVKDYNEFYQENVRVIRCDFSDLPEVMYDLYDTDNFEIDEDTKEIELFY